MLFSSCILVTLKFAAGRQVCRPSRAELGLKDWAIESIQINYYSYEYGGKSLSNRLLAMEHTLLITSNCNYKILFT
jgi:hypothetical protein